MSIQDDYFELTYYFEKRGPKWAKEALKRIWDWGVDCENENEELRPIVGRMREAISLMFKKKEEE